MRLLSRAAGCSNCTRLRRALRVEEAPRGRRPRHEPLAYSGGMQPGQLRVHLLSFGPLRSALPEGGLWRELRTGTSVSTLLSEMREECVFPEGSLLAAAVAINHEYAGPEHLLRDGDEVAILPPVSGGADDLVQIVKEPIDSQMAQGIVSAVKSGGDGAVCVFDGIVRDN